LHWFVYEVNISLSRYIFPLIDLQKSHKNHPARESLQSCLHIIADYQRTGGNRLHSIGLQSARGRGVPNVTGAGESIQLYDGRW